MYSFLVALRTSAGAFGSAPWVPFLMVIPQARSVRSMYAMTASTRSCAPPESRVSVKGLSLYKNL